MVIETLDQAPDLSKLEVVSVDLKAPPFVHDFDQVAKGGPKIVKFTMPIVEKEIEVEKGVKLRAMTFGGTIPGPMMVVHEGDYIELTIVNPSTNEQVHNIDFHASTGAMGGGEITMVAPGQEVTMRFKADRAGTFVYHCAPGGAMTPWHMVNGMNGAIMVLPRKGLKDEKGKKLRFDKVMYIGESDFYIPKDKDGKYKSYDSLNESIMDSLDAMRTLVPTHVVFNGSVGALTGKNALKSKVGETVLFVHSQANRDSRPHLIGGHADYAWETGKFNNPPEKDLETWFIRGGSAGAALYTFKQPGLYAYVNHNLIEAILLGAAAHVMVEGDKWNHDLMTLTSPTGPIKADTKLDLPK
ncbi:MAG TPA: copper-containing nitrite reductase [Pseudomonadales bacterium]|nr:copper-containing nitrite reductase [Pseudomonadales bacterium]